MATTAKLIVVVVVISALSAVVGAAVALVAENNIGQVLTAIAFLAILVFAAYRLTEHQRK